MQRVNQKSSFLLEIGTEDLPARFLPNIIQQLKEKTEQILKEYLIDFSEIKIYGTPRRLVVIGDGIPSLQRDRSKEIFGPPQNIAFDKDGNPTNAAIGFAKSQGLNVENLLIKKRGKGTYVVALIKEKGKPIKDLLPEVFKRIIFSLHLPKSMRWGMSSLRFIRPIRWLLALLDKETINFEIDGIKSGNTTSGHRFLSPDSLEIEEIKSYERLLENNFVVVDQLKRKKIITKKMKELLEPISKKPVYDEELLETVVHLVEYPSPVLGNFSVEYLKLPKELLIVVMKEHQKYFAVEDAEGKLTNHFVVISNTHEDNAETVRIGAERVIKARFEDASFYFDEDIKNPLSGKIDELKKVTFHENLGSLYDKTERLVSISGILADKILPSEKEIIVRSALLSKTDLVTGIVREFPELQGTIGKYYALNDGENSEISIALEEQYLPKHSGGKLPQSDAGSILSISDKIDNITAFFSIGITPTGSEDPLALRRQALGIISILFEKGYDINLNELVEISLNNFKNIKDNLYIKNNILTFLKNRLETVLSDQGYSPDLIQSILSLSTNIRLFDIKNRLDAIKRFTSHPLYNNFLTAVKRVNNILPKEAIFDYKTDLFKEEPEIRLKENLDSIQQTLPSLLEEKRYFDAIILLTSLTDPINIFFDNVLVMDKNEEIRQNRLALLYNIWKTISTIADFSKLKEAN